MVWEGNVHLILHSNQVIITHVGHLPFHPELQGNKIRLQPWTNFICGCDASTNSDFLVHEPICSYDCRDIRAHCPLNFHTHHPKMKEN